MCYKVTNPEVAMLLLGGYVLNIVPFQMLDENFQNEILHDTPSAGAAV